MPAFESKPGKALRPPNPQFWGNLEDIRRYFSPSLGAGDEGLKKENRAGQRPALCQRRKDRRQARYFVLPAIIVPALFFAAASFFWSSSLLLHPRSRLPASAANSSKTGLTFDVFKRGFLPIPIMELSEHCRSGICSYRSCCCRHNRRDSCKRRARPDWSAPASHDR